MRSPAALATEGLRLVRRNRPLIHHMTNSVVTNLTANITLCLGASPVMATAAEESAEMASHAGALLLNIGTLDPRLVESMVAAGEKANELGIPVIFDPVGAGATRLRTESAGLLMSRLKISVIKGNAGEVLSLCGRTDCVRGVDSEGASFDRDAFRGLATMTGAVVGVTGETDFVTDGENDASVAFGHPIMGRITGMGCAATTAVACFVAAGGPLLERVTGGLAAFGIAGRLAADKSYGPGTFVPNLLDALASLSEESEHWQKSQA